MNGTSKLTHAALLCTFGLMLSYIEAIIPMPINVPGAKLGLANICVIFALHRFGFRFALSVSVTRVLLSALLFGSMLSFTYSICGALFSLAAMYFVNKSRAFSVTAMSVCGAVAHNLGQLIAAALILSSEEIMLYFPVLSLSGAIFGVIIGIIAAIIISRYDAKSKK